MHAGYLEVGAAVRLIKVSTVWPRGPSALSCLHSRQHTRARVGRRVAGPGRCAARDRLYSIRVGYISSSGQKRSFRKERLAASLVVGTVRRLSATQLPGLIRDRAECHETKAACSRARLSKADRARSLSTRAPHDLRHGVVVTCATTTNCLCALHLKNRPEPRSMSCSMGTLLGTGSNDGAAIHPYRYRCRYFSAEIESLLRYFDPTNTRKGEDRCVTPVEAERSREDRTARGRGVGQPPSYLVYDLKHRNWYACSMSLRRRLTRRAVLQYVTNSTTSM